MRRLRQDAQMLFRQLGIGHSHKLLFEFPLAGNIAEPADDGALGLLFVFAFILIFAGIIKRLQVRTNQHEQQHCTREKFHEVPCRPLSDQEDCTVRSNPPLQGVTLWSALH